MGLPGPDPAPSLDMHPQPPKPRPPEGRQAPLCWTLLDTVILFAVTLGGAVIRFARLAYPNAFVFDEVYYAKDACLYLGHAPSFCKLTQATEQSFVHPPLGKWIIAMGIKVFGFNTFGWRFMAAVFGTAMIPIAFFIGRKLFGRFAGAATGLLVAADFLLIVQSRVAMLDIFLTFFVALGFLFVVLERERVVRMREAGGGPLDLRWRLAAGASFGAAASVKWSGAYPFVAAAPLVVWWVVGTAVAIRRQEAPGERPRAPSPLLELNLTLVTMVAPLVLVYLLSYAVWFYDHHFVVSQFLSLQNSMLQYHLHLTQKHTYASPAWKWPILYRPVAYYFTGGARATHILAFGNPATWWPALAAGVWMAVQSFRFPRSAAGRHLAAPSVRTDGLALPPQSPDDPDFYRMSPGPPGPPGPPPGARLGHSYLSGVVWAPTTFVIAAWLSQYLPWAAFSRPQFFFYMSPIVPFMMVALAAMLRDILRGYLKETALVAACLGAALLGLTAFLMWAHPFGFGVDLASQRRIVEIAGVPILALGAAMALGYSESTAGLRRILVGVYLVLACVGVGYYFYPVVAAWSIPFNQWQHRMLFPTWV